jgi:hypothetical protein
MRLGLWAMAAVSVLAVGAFARADAFDSYTNPILAKAVEEGKLEEVKELSSRQLIDAGGVLKGAAGAFLVVQTNNNRIAKALVTAAGQKVSAEERVPMLLVDRYVTFRDGTERGIQAAGQNVGVYGGLRFSLDLGQVVPERLGGDLAVEPSGTSSITVKPIGKARMFLVTKPLPEATPKKPGKLEVGDRFEVRYFNGTYKLYDDGRRSGTLELKVTDEGDVTGSFTSDRDGSKYEVTGKVGSPKHAITFTVKLPAVEQNYAGMLFTGNGKALAGTSKLQGREAAFYAVRVEDD